jgi:hypothetical protein
VVIHNTDKDIKYKVVGVSAGSLESTVASYLDGSLKPFIKSEPVPEDNSGPVKTAVADNWAELMEVDTADSLVMFYAPWCVRGRDRGREGESTHHQHNVLRCLELPWLRSAAQAPCGVARGGSRGLMRDATPRAAHVHANAVVQREQLCCPGRVLTECAWTFLDYATKDDGRAALGERRTSTSVSRRPFVPWRCLTSLNSIPAVCRCGHCKKLHPIIAQVGEHFASDASVQIVQMDFTANELTDKSYAVKGYPTLYLRQATGALVPYSGDRSMADLIKFVEDNRTVGKKEHDEL